MKDSRRNFIKQALLGTGGILISDGLLASNLSNSKKDYIQLTVLHTNDVHSHIDPFPENDPKYPGLGGVSRRYNLIQQIRAEGNEVLLLDAGDIFQGTPYFNMYGGELELKLMSKMRYDAATMGNHDFDNGMEGFLKMLPNANFPFICSNYNFENTILKEKTIPYKIINKGKLKIGIIGIGIELNGLVDSTLYGNTEYQDPIEKANKYAALLKEKYQCNLVICLSHLGYQYQEDKISDILLTKKTENIDLIIGGHTHTFLDNAQVFTNKIGNEVLVNQAGWAGLSLGRVDFFFEKGTIKQVKNSTQKNSYKINNI